MGALAGDLTKTSWAAGKRQDSQHEMRKEAIKAKVMYNLSKEHKVSAQKKAAATQ